MENTKKHSRYSDEELKEIMIGFSESKLAKDKFESAKKAIEKLRPQLEKDFGFIFENVDKK